MVFLFINKNESHGHKESQHFCMGQINLVRNVKRSFIDGINNSQVKKKKKKNLIKAGNLLNLYVLKHKDLN
jgi:hypothetical protein